jgi:hypothetical protein
VKAVLGENHELSGLAGDYPLTLDPVEVRHRCQVAYYLPVFGNEGPGGESDPKAGSCPTRAERSPCLHGLRGDEATQCCVISCTPPGNPRPQLSGLSLHRFTVMVRLTTLKGPDR